MRSAIVLAAFAIPLLAAGCGREPGQAPPEPLDVNAALETPGNDASALELAVNASEPEPTPSANAANGANGNSGRDEATPVLGDTSGGDTGGNVIER